MRPIVAVAPEVIGKFTLASRLDVGEMETLSFALEADDALVLIDDAVGRREARRSGLRVKGTLGVIADAYRHASVLSRPYVVTLGRELLRGTQ